MKFSDLDFKHKIVSGWYFVSIFFIFWDVGYCFLRPRSMRGGDLHWIWAPYSIYQDVDWIYGVKALQEGNGFTNAQSFMNFVENCMNIVYLYKTHISPSPVAPLLGISSAFMTLSKTVLYWAQEYYCDFCAIGHNTAIDLFFLWVLPNGLWIVFPTIVIWVLWPDIAQSLRITAPLTSNGKTASIAAKQKATNGKLH